MPEKLGAYSGGIRAATSQFSGAGEGGPKLIAFEADVTNDEHLPKDLKGPTGHRKYARRVALDWCASPDPRRSVGIMNSPGGINNHPVIIRAQYGSVDAGYISGGLQPNPAVFQG